MNEKLKPCPFYDGDCKIKAVEAWNRRENDETD